MGIANDFVDTADTCGHGHNHNEQLIGQLISERGRDAVKIATRFGIAREEHCQVIEIVVQAANGRIPVIEPSPAGVKYACSRLGLCEAYVRLPMVALESETRTAIDMAMS